MLLLQFQAGNDRYGLEVSRVIEVIPMVAFRPLPHAEESVAGLFNYRGTMVPVIDVTVLLASTPSRPLMSTRIILVDYTGRDGEPHVLGLLAERVTETVSCTEGELKPIGIDVPEAPYLGEILIYPGGMLQRLKIENLLPPSLQEALFVPLKDSE
jgi:chemotaxis-related protein WspB